MQSIDFAQAPEAQAKEQPGMTRNSGASGFLLGQPMVSMKPESNSPQRGGGN